MLARPARPAAAAGRARRGRSRRGRAPRRRARGRAAASAPAATGTSPRPASSSTRSAFAVVFSSVWLPATVVTPTSSSSGEASASSSAIASSWPGSQSRMIGVGVMRASIASTSAGRSAATAARRARRGERAGGAGAAQRLVARPALEQRDDEAGRERVAGARCRRPRSTCGGAARATSRAVLVAAPRPRRRSVTRDELPALETTSCSRRLTTSRSGSRSIGTRRRGVEREERRRLARPPARPRPGPRAGRARRPRPARGVSSAFAPGDDDDLVLARGVDEDQRDAGLRRAARARARRRPRAALRAPRRRSASSPTAPIMRTFAPSRAAATAWFAPLPPGCASKRAPRTVSPGPRQPLDARDEVEVDRADDGELDCHAATSMRRARAGRRARGRTGSRAGRRGRPRASRGRASTPSATDADEAFERAHEDGQLEVGGGDAMRRRRRRRRARARAPSRRARPRSARRTTTGPRRASASSSSR